MIVFHCITFNRQYLGFVTLGCLVWVWFVFLFFLMLTQEVLGAHGGSADVRMPIKEMSSVNIQHRVSWVIVRIPLLHGNGNQIVWSSHLPLIRAPNGGKERTDGSPKDGDSFDEKKEEQEEARRNEKATPNNVTMWDLEKKYFHSEQHNKTLQENAKTCTSVTTNYPYATSVIITANIRIKTIKWKKKT